MDGNYVPIASRVYPCPGAVERDDNILTFIGLELGRIENKNYVVLLSCNHRGDNHKKEASCRKVKCEGDCRHDLSTSLLKEMFFPQIDVGILTPLD